MSGFHRKSKQRLFETISTPLGTSPIADLPQDILTFTSSDSSISITGTAATDTINFTASPTSIGVLSFSTINAPAGTDPIADTATDTLNLTSSAGLTITGTAATDTIDWTLSDNLVDIAGLSDADNNFIVGNGTNFVAESGATARTSLGLGTGDSPTFTDLTLSALTASRLVQTGAGSSLDSVANFTTFVAGTTNQISVADDGDGTITLSTPQNIHTSATPTFSDLTLSSFTLGSVLFAGTAGAINEDNANFFWDDTNNRLGIGTTSPAVALHNTGKTYTTDVFNGTSTVNSLNLGGYDAAYAPENFGKIKIMTSMAWAESFTMAANATDPILSVTGTVTKTGGSVAFLPVINDSRILRYATGNAFTIIPALYTQFIYTPTATGLLDALTSYTGVFSQPQYIPDVGAGNTAATPLICGFHANPKAAMTSGTSSTITLLAGFHTWDYEFFSNTVSGATTVTNFVHYNCGAIVKAGASTFTNMYSFIATVNGAGSTLNASFASPLNANSTINWNIYQTGTALNRLRGDTHIGVNSGSPGTTLELTGDHSRIPTTFAPAAGNNNNVATTDTSVIFMSASPGAGFTMTGFAGGVNGKRLDVINATGQIMTIANQDVNSTAANRIITATGASQVTVGDGASTFIYIGSESRWRLTNLEG